MTGEKKDVIVTIIEKKLRSALSPSALYIIDESSLHVGHAGAIPGKSTHFRLKITSDKFRGLSKVAQHRLVYEILSEELKHDIHALALTTLAS